MSESSSFSFSTFVASLAKLGIKSVRAKKANVKKPFLLSMPLRRSVTQAVCVIRTYPTARQSIARMMAQHEGYTTIFVNIFHQTGSFLPTD